MIIFLWLVFSPIVGMYADSQNKGGIASFFLSLIFSPIIGFIIVLLSSPKDYKQRKEKEEMEEIERRESLEIQKLQYKLMMEQAEKENEKIKKEDADLEVLKKDKLSIILSDWEEGRITEEQYKIKKEKIMLM